MSESLAMTMAAILQVTRYLVGAAFVVALVVALTHWLVREQKLAPFSAWARFVRSWSDPLLRPIERRLTRAGGNPQHAPWWLAGLVVVGGLVLIEALRWLFQTVANIAFAGSAGPTALAATLLHLTFSLLMLALLVRVIGSWVGLGRHTRWIGWSYRLTDWIVEPLRRVLPPLGMFDLSPLAAYLLLLLLRNLVFSAIF